MDASSLERLSMDDIMRRWPATIRVILRHRLLCVGCPIAPFHTIEDAVREHGLDGVRLREELLAAVSSADAGAYRSRAEPSAITMRR